MLYNFWMVKIPLPVRDHVEQLAHVERRRATDMLRLLIEDALAQRGLPVTNNEVMKKVDVLGRSLAGRMRS
jgi:hypothetical protein